MYKINIDTSPILFLIYINEIPYNTCFAECMRFSAVQAKAWHFGCVPQILLEFALDDSGGCFVASRLDSEYKHAEFL